MSTDLLNASAVTKRFGGVTAVDSVSMSLGAGEVLGIIGPNGAGKTALLNCLTGVYPLDTGTVYLRGRAIHRLRPHQVAGLGVARTFQSTEHLSDLRVFEYVLIGVTPRQAWRCVACGLRLPSARTNERAERVRAATVLGDLGLDAYFDARLREVPYGVQKRIDVARVIANSPQIVLLDEPTSGTNERDRLDVAEAVRALHERDIAMIVVDHDVGFVRSVCERLIVMVNGAVLAQGTPDNVLAMPRVQEAYLGSTAITGPAKSDESGSSGSLSLDRQGIDGRPDAPGDG